MGLLLECNVSLAALRNERFRNLLSRNGYAIPCNIDKYVPLLRQIELDKIQKELYGRNVVLIFDGTTHSSECLTVVVRYFGGLRMVPTHRVIGLRLLEKAPTGKELAGQIVDLFYRRLGIRTDGVLG